MILSNKYEASMNSLIHSLSLFRPGVCWHLLFADVGWAAPVEEHLLPIPPLSTPRPLMRGSVEK